MNTVVGHSHLAIIVEHFWVSFLLLSILGLHWMFRSGTRSPCLGGQFWSLLSFVVVVINCVIIHCRTLHPKQHGYRDSLTSQDSVAQNTSGFICETPQPTTTTTTATTTNHRRCCCFRLFFAFLENLPNNNSISSRHCVFDCLLRIVCLFVDCEREKSYLGSR